MPQKNADRLQRPIEKSGSLSRAFRKRLNSNQLVGLAASAQRAGALLNRLPRLRFSPYATGCDPLSLRRTAGPCSPLRAG